MVCKTVIGHVIRDVLEGSIVDFHYNIFYFMKGFSFKLITIFTLALQFHTRRFIFYLLFNKGSWITI